MSQATISKPRSRAAAGPLVEAVGTLATSVTDAFSEFARTVTPVAPRGVHPVSHRCPQCDEPCRRCRDDCTCHCTCCVCDADVVVFTRLGERRVVPLVIENTRRRERQITLDLSGFATKGGGEAPVQVELLGPKKFELAGCSEHETTLLVDVSPGRDVAASRAGRKGEDRELPDVDDCLVAVGDLRVEGCDIRPVRIAVAVLPRDCDPFEIECGCGCC
jgi:hypothetical protein